MISTILAWRVAVGRVREEREMREMSSPRLQPAPRATEAGHKSNTSHHGKQLRKKVSRATAS
eukprot:scaffold170974_cov64-Cyclotella_meneghiniana.AAC.3